MENNAPNYAEWIPEAGGYVANGSVVSKSPQYGEDGKLKLSVDTSVFGNTNEKPSTIKAQPQSANNPLSNNGITTANTQGSNEDVNSLVTNIGSMESLNDNTATTGSAISTPAVNSNIAKINPLTSMDEINQGYQDAVARNDIKAQIDYLIAAQQIDGIDRTQQINNLWRARGEKIRTQDDQYLQRLNQATTPQEYAQIQAEQNAWRDMVGYQDQLNRDFQIKQEELKIDYDDTWNKSINDITQSILQLTGNILNFQYDPMSDRALNMAQAQVQLRMKNQFAATGMYYSSATQYAITQAIQELVPVYEKMAKDELRNNLSMLQQTASYLMNLDEHQFNQWKTQIQMKWQQNDEKRKDVAAAWERMNQLGYADNEVSAILGIPAGTASYEARKYAQEKQDQIDAEERALANSKALERFKTNMDIELANEQARLNREYYAFQVANPKPSGSGSTSNDGLSYAQLKETLKNYIKSGASQDEVINKAQELGKNAVEIEAAVTNAYADAEADQKKEDDKAATGGRSIDQKQTDLNEMLGTSKPSAVLKDAVRYANGDETVLATLLNAVKYPKDDSELSGKNVFNPEALKLMGANAYGVYVDFMADNKGTPSEIANKAEKFIDSFRRDHKEVTDEEFSNALAQFNEDIIQSLVNRAQDAYSDENSGETNAAVKKALGAIETYANSVAGSNAGNKQAIISDAFIRLITSIGNKSDEAFDYNWLPGNTGAKSKIEAYANIASSIRDNPSYGANSNMKNVYDTVIDTLDALIGHDGLSAEDVMKTAWFAGY